ncbi:MAG TPA: chemotaxis protein CheA [Malonomonas sp.]
MDIAKYRDMFLSEAAEHLQQMTALLVAVEQQPADKDTVAALFRAVHSIKGMAATMGFSATAHLAHHLEDSLDLCREQGQIDSEQIDQLLAGVDLLDGLLDDITAQRPERDVDGFIAASAICLQELGPEHMTPVEVADQLDGEGLRLELHLAEKVAAVGPRLLVLIRQLEKFGKVLETSPSEEQIMQGGAPRLLRVRLQTALSQEQLQQQLRQFSELSDILFPVEKASQRPQKKPATAASTVRVSTDLLDHFINLTGELITNRYSLQTAASEQNWQDLHEGLGQLTRLVKNLHHQVLQVRMMPLASITGRLPRAVRDLCRSSGKEVSLEIEGADIELDRAILEELTDPLMHMLRNAVDHGIKERGKVLIKAWRERDQVLIQVADDGCGIDPQKICQRALERNLISPAQAETIRNYDLLQLICSPGFSTAAEVSATSGRGVGMDVVKTAVERLGGVLLIDSVLGEGSKITMKLPLSVAIIRVLMIDCAEMLLALPITRVLQTIEILPEEIQTSGKQLVISHQGELLPLLSLRKILKRPKGPKQKLLPLVITEVLGRKVGLVVDRLVGQREVFVQPLPTPFERLRGCSGGTILGDGRLMFVFDLQSLLEKRRG